MANDPNLNFDSILDIALKGARRSSVFMGLGVNAAIDPSHNNYQLSGITQIQLIPDNVPQETLKHFKEEFRIWIEACALREAIESFVLFLDALNHACTIVHALKNNLSIEDVTEMQRTFSREGLPNKFNILKQRYGVTSTHTEKIVLINKARNCLTHRKGEVGLDDTGNQKVLTVAWLGLDLFVEEPDGTRLDLNEIPEGGLLLKNGGQVMAAIAERRHTFELNDMLVLSPRDLAEICWFLTNEAKNITQAAVQYALDNGVVIKPANLDKD